MASQSSRRRRSVEAGTNAISGKLLLNSLYDLNGLPTLDPLTGQPVALSMRKVLERAMLRTPISPADAQCMVGATRVASATRKSCCCYGPGRLLQPGPGHPRARPPSTSAATFEGVDPHARSSTTRPVGVEVHERQFVQSRIDAELPRLVEHESDDLVAFDRVKPLEVAEHSRARMSTNCPRKGRL